MKIKAPDSDIQIKNRWDLIKFCISEGWKLTPRRQKKWAVLGIASLLIVFGARAEIIKIIQVGILSRQTVTVGTDANSGDGKKVSVPVEATTPNGVAAKDNDVAAPNFSSPEVNGLRKEVHEITSGVMFPKEPAKQAAQYLRMMAPAFASKGPDSSAYVDARWYVQLLAVSRGFAKLNLHSDVLSKDMDDIVADRGTVRMFNEVADELDRLADKIAIKYDSQGNLHQSVL